MKRRNVNKGNKYYSIFVIIAVILNLMVHQGLVFAADVDLFYDYVKTFEQAPNQKTYSQQLQGEKQNGNEGIIASKVVDFDEDGQNELLILLLDWDYVNKINALDFVVAEIENNTVIEKSKVRLTDSSSCVNGYLQENLKVVLKDNKYLGYVYSETPIQGTGITYKICTYDGNQIHTTKNLYNPGYTSGVALYDVSNCTKQDYYNSGVCLFAHEEGFEKTGAYNSYDEAVTNEMSECGIISYSSDEYSHDVFIDSAEILCELTAQGKYEPLPSGTVTATSYITSYVNEPYTKSTSPSDFDEIYSIITSYTEKKGTITVSNDLSIEVNGREVDFTDAYPFIDSAGRTQVPVRFVAETLGYEVDWEQGTMNSGNGVVAIRPGNISLEFDGEIIYRTLGLSIGSNAIEVSHEDGPSTSNRHWLGSEYVYMDTVAMIRDERTYIPIRYVAELLGYEVVWK